MSTELPRLRELKKVDYKNPTQKQQQDEADAYLELAAATKQTRRGDVGTGASGSSGSKAPGAKLRPVTRYIFAHRDVDHQNAVRLDRIMIL